MENKDTPMSFKERYNTELYHYGVKGQKWGIRRYQNKDGTLTAAGKSRRNAESKYKTDEESDHVLLSRVKGDDDVEGWSSLHKEICTKSGDWYEGEGVSPGFKKALADHEQRRNEIDEQYGVAAAEKVLNDAADKWTNQHSKLQKEEIAKHPRYSELDSELKNLSNKYFDKYKSMSDEEILKNKGEILKHVDAFNRERKPLEEEKKKIWREMMDNVDKDSTLNKFREDWLKASNNLRNTKRNSGWQKAVDDYEKNFVSELHGVVLNDLGYRNTKRAREFLNDNMLVFYD